MPDFLYRLQAEFLKCQAPDSEKTAVLNQSLITENACAKSMQKYRYFPHIPSASYLRPEKITSGITS
jgi:hypothetical protein